MAEPAPQAKPPPQPVGIPQTTAKTLWCPFTGRSGYQVNTGADPETGLTPIRTNYCCITTQCMLWHADVGAPNSDQPTGWCSMSTLAPGEQPISRQLEPTTPTPKA